MFVILEAEVCHLEAEVCHPEAEGSLPKFLAALGMTSKRDRSGVFLSEIRTTLSVQTRLSEVVFLAQKLLL